MLAQVFLVLGEPSIPYGDRAVCPAIKQIWDVSGSVFPCDDDLAPLELEKRYYTGISRSDAVGVPLPAPDSS